MFLQLLIINFIINLHYQKSIKKSTKKYISVYGIIIDIYSYTLYMTFHKIIKKMTLL